MNGSQHADGSPASIAFYMHDLSGGGVERMRLLLIEELRARGRQVTLVVQSGHGPLKALLPRDLPLVILGRSRTWSSVIALARFLRAERPGILVASLDHNNIAALLARTLSRSGTALFICQHNALSAERGLGWKYRVVPALYRLLHRSAEAIIAVSDGVADDLAAVTGIDRTRITTIYNPVIDRHFDDRAAAVCPDGWLHDGAAPVFVFAGRLSPQKDPQTLLQAFALVLGAMPARLLILGDGPLRQELEAEAHRLNISGAGTFAGFQANPLPWIARASALVLSSRYEGFGNVIVEALACGTPVAATDCPWGPAQILEDGRFGVLAAPGDPFALSLAMRQCVQTPWNKALLRERGARFSTVACADRHLALFDKAARRRAPAKQQRILGMALSDCPAAETVRTLFEQRASSVCLVVTPNLDHLRQLRSPEFAEAYASAALRCPDGFPVLLYARLRGLRLKVRVTGCELFQRIAAQAVVARQRLFIVTESHESEEAVAAWAERRGLQGYVRSATAPAGLLDHRNAQLELIEAIAAHAPAILIMTLGAPTSEIFIHRNRGSLPPCWALCLGQAVRVELGLAVRAPALWQRLGLEWLWRLRQEPGRLAGRYAKSALWFPVAIARDLLGAADREAALPAAGADQDTSTAS